MNIGITELLLIAVIVFLLFGTRKLRGIGGDVGTAIRDFKSAMRDDKSPTVAGSKPVAASIENDKE